MNQTLDSRGFATASTRTRSTVAINVVIVLLIGIAAFFLYLRTLAQTVLPGDSGEFQVLAYVLGNTHNTGYPIYLLLAHPFTLLPLDSVAYSVNLFSALMAALAVVIVYGCGRLLTGRPIPALLGATALMVSPSFWSQALIAEVYTAGAAFLAGVILALLAWRATRRPVYLLVAGLLGGLSLGVHMTVALLAPAVLIFLLYTLRGDRQGWLAALLGTLLGLALYLSAFFYLDWRAPTANFIDVAIQPSRSVWGLTEDDLNSPWERYWFSVSGRQFQDRMFQLDTLPRNIFRYLDGITDEFVLPALVLIGVGIAWTLRHGRAVGFLLLLALVCQWVYTWTYDIWDYYVFFIAGYVVLAIFLTAGVAALEAAIQRVLGRMSRLQVAAGALLPLLLLFFVVWPNLSPHLKDVQAGRVPAFRFDGYPVERFNLTGLYHRVTATVAQLPQNAIVFTEWPVLYPLYYAAYVEQGRTDLTFIEQKPYRPGAGSESSAINFIAAHIEKHPIYFAECLPELREAGYRCEAMQVGPDRYQKLGSLGP